MYYQMLRSAYWSTIKKVISPQIFVRHQIGIALVNFIQRVGARDQFIQLQLAQFIEREQLGDVVGGLR